MELARYATLDDVRASAIQIMDRNMDFDALLKEMSNVCTNTSQTKDNHPDIPVSGVLGDRGNDVQTILEGLKLQASVSKMDIKVAAVQMVMKRLSLISQSFTMVMDDRTKNRSFHTMMSALKEVDSSVKISTNVLLQYCDGFQHCLPLNVLLQLHQQNIVMLKDYLMVNISKKDVLKEFIWGLQQVTQQSEVQDEHGMEMAKNTSVGILTSLIQYAYGNTGTNKALKKMSAYILFSIVKYHLQYLTSLSPAKVVARDGQTVIRKICDNFEDEKSTLQHCFTQMISLWVTHSPTLKVSDAVSRQHTWIACKQNERPTTFYKEMISCIGCKQTVSVISNILDRKEINWKNLLTFVSALLVCFQDAPKYLEELIGAKLKDGFESLSREPLTVGFLLARQLSLEGNHAFTSYATWFQKHFGTNSTLASSNRAFRFFIGFLTDLVPYEPAKYLKVHVVKPPHAPPSCSEKLQEYMMLARCRLSELGGTFLENVDELNKSAEVEKDVKCAIDEFEKNRKIPKSLMETSIFKKAYFCGKFLPTLLRPRPLPSIRDTTMLLIEELVKAQKIPKNMYAAYKEGCQKENTRLLEEVMVLDSDSAFEEDADDPEAKVEAVLQTINTTIKSIMPGSTNAGITGLPCEVLTKFSRILHTIQSEDITRKMQENPEIDLCSDKLVNPSLRKITQLLFNWLGKFHEDMTCYKNKAVLATCLSGVLKVLFEHKCVLQAVCEEIWKSCTSGLAQVAELQQKGMCVYLALMGNDVHVQIPILPHCKARIMRSSLTKVLKDWKTVCTCSLACAVEYSIHYQKDGGSMMVAVKFSCLLAENVLSARGTLDALLIHDLMYFHARLKGKSGQRLVLHSHQDEPERKKIRTDQEDILKCVEMLSQLLPRIVNVEGVSRTLPPDEFLIREATVNTKNDVLNMGERLTVYVKAFFQSDLNEKSIKSIIHCLLDIWTQGMKVENNEVVNQLLESLPLVIEACSGISSAADFLLGVFTERTATVSQDFNFGDAMRRKSEVQAFLKMLLQLPNRILFMTWSQDKDLSDIWSGDHGEVKDCTAPKDLQPIGELVKRIYCLSDKSWHHTFVLPHKLASHLLRGLLESLKDTPELLRFLLTVCPWLFVSLVVYWKDDPGMQFFVKLRNEEFHCFVASIVEVLLGESDHENTIMYAIEMLTAKYNNCQEMLVECRTEDVTCCRLCISCAAIDLLDEGLETQKLLALLKEATQEALASVATCSILKSACEEYYGTEEPPSNFCKTSNKVLEHCLRLMDAEAVCTVLSGKADGLPVFLPEDKTSLFHFSALRCLSSIQLPMTLLKSEGFLSIVVDLEDSSSILFGHEESYKISQFCPGIKRLHDLAVKHHSK